MIKIRNLITIEDYLKARRTIAEYKHQMNRPAIIHRYLKMLIPSFGVFSNNYYDIAGVMWFGRLIGMCTRSRHKSYMNVGDWRNLRQYHLRTDIIQQFFK